MSTIESWTHVQMRWLICTLLIHLQMSLDSFANKDSFAYEFWIICKWSWHICKLVISHLQMSLSRQPFFNNLLQKFAFVPNWVWKKESFLMLTISIWKVSFFYLCEYLLKEVKSEDFGLNWVWWIESFLTFPVWKEIANRAHYYPSKTFSEKLDQAEFDSYLVWCLNLFLDQHNVSKISVWEEECLFLLTLWNKPSQWIQRCNFGKKWVWRRKKYIRIFEFQRRKHIKK